jgi:hypothetical protein
VIQAIRLPICLLTFVFLVGGPLLAADQSWVPPAIRAIAQSKPDVWFFRMDSQSEDDLMGLFRPESRHQEGLRKQIAKWLKTAYRVPADQTQKLFAILLYPPNYDDPNLPMDMIMNPPSVGCIFESKTSAAMIGVGDWCVTIHGYNRANDLVIFSGRGAASFRHWASRQEKAAGLTQKTDVRKAQPVALPQ